MKNILKNFLFLLLSTFAVAQNADRKFVGFRQNPLNLEVSVSDGKYQIRFFTEAIVETSFIPTGETFNPESHAVVLTPNRITPQLKNSAGTIKYSAGGMTVEIQKSPFRIAYWYKGKELISEKNGYAKKQNVRDGKPETLETLNFNLADDEALYGGGARVLGMNRRGNRLQLYNRAHYGYESRAELMNFCIPLVMSSKIYAVHFDNPAIGYLDLDSKKDNTLSYETISGRKTYQVIAGESWAKLIENYTALTGRQPLPPLWTFGNFASRFGYRDQEMAATTARLYSEKEIPVDAMIFDLYWFGKTIKGTMGNLEFDKETFPDPQKMLTDLNNQGIKPILITEPFILTTSKKWTEAVDKKILATDGSGKPFVYNFYFGNTGLIDIFKPEARDWFWNIYKNLAKQGVAGVWGDLGEPEVFPSEAVTVKGRADEVHNIYGHEWAKMVFEGYKKDFPDVRPFILMRSGYSGSQRFGMIPWSGDVNRSWGGLSGQAEIALEMGMQGLAYMHSDLGGFAGEYNDSELYLRWLQYGVFQPIFRPHAQELVASEPVYKDIRIMEKARELIKLRYRMLPYNYTIAAENHRTGMPMMRPLFFAEPENKDLLGKSDTYLWGNDFLVTPIIKPGVTSAAVYFPEGNWFDFYTGEKHAGNKTAAVNVAADHIPVFVRGGAMIPMTYDYRNTEEHSRSTMRIDFYYDPETETSAGQLYLDDGKTPDAFEKSNYEMLTFTSSARSNDIDITIADKAGKRYENISKYYTLSLRNVSSKPKKVTVQNKETLCIFNPENNSYDIPLDIRPGNTKIKIEL